jgi:hypothetical protein
MVSTCVDMLSVLVRIWGILFARPMRARAVKAGGPTHMNSAGRCSLFGRPDSISLPIIWAYIMKDTEKPKPWQVSPAVMIAIGEMLSWASKITVAIVPVNMTGKMGKIQLGIIDCSLKLWLSNRYVYCPTASIKVKVK